MNVDAEYLIDAVRSGNLGMLMTLTEEKRVDVNERDGSGHTALLVAAGLSSDRTGTINMLLSSGADPNLREPDRGRTALHLLALGRRDASVKSLLQSGADLLAKDNDGLTALDLARQAGFTTIVNLLEDAAALRQRKELLYLNTAGVVFSVAITSDGSTIACAHKGSIQLWDLSEKKRICECNAHGGDIIDALCFTFDKKYLLSAGWDDQVCLWSIAKSGMALERSAECGGHATSLCVLADSGVPSACEVPGREDVVWELESGRRLSVFATRETKSRFLPGGKICVVGDENGKLTFRELPERNVAKVLEGHTGGIDSVAISGNGQFLLSESHKGNNYGELRFWCVETGECLAKHVEDASMTSIALSHDGRVAVANFRLNILVWQPL